jgi:hypothetical protein
MRKGFDSARLQANKNEQLLELKLYLSAASIEKIFGEQLQRTPAGSTFLNNLAMAEQRIADAESRMQLAEFALLHILKTCTCHPKRSEYLSPPTSGGPQLRRYASTSFTRR